jgi:hypothetical protein
MNYSLKNLLNRKKLEDSVDSSNLSQSTDTKTVNTENEFKDFEMEMSHICPSEELDDEKLNEENEMNQKRAVAKPMDLDDDDEEENTVEKIIENLPSDLKPLKDCMMNAQGCCLLLILKQFLKEVYSITDV